MGVVAMKNVQKEISRRMLIVGGVAAGSASLLAAADAHASAKVQKSAVRFSPVATVAGHSCGTCKLFKAPSDCLFVQGPVSQDCSCWIWRDKTA